MTIKLRFKRILLLVSFILFMFAAFYNGLTIKCYSFNSEKINYPTRIVVLADLHSHIYGNNQNDLIDIVNKQNPDIILLVGDIADDQVSIEGTELLLKGLMDTAPIYYVTGNHEYWSNNIGEILSIIRSYGVAILSDEYTKISINNNSFIIAGIEDPSKKDYKDSTYNQEKAMSDAFLDLGEIDGYKILMAHRPEKIDLYKNYDFDMVVSGHSHGGQIRIPFLINGLVAPNQGLFPKYAGGAYTHDKLIHIVSRGVSFNPRLPRVFNPPEIVVIDLKPIE